MPFVGSVALIIPTHGVLPSTVGAEVEQSGQYKRDHQM